MIQYLQLYSTYPQTLSCPCTQISINYKTFLDIQYTFHQVCDSVFVTEDWIAYLSTTYQNGNASDLDFRWQSSSIFEALNAFCGLINQTISNRLTQFYSSQYVGASVVPSQVFDSQANSSISEFILSTTNDFLLSLSTIRDTTQSNALFSGEGTNYEQYTPGGYGYTYAYALSYGDCSCSLSAACIEQSSILKSSGKVSFSVPGFYEGCYIIESLLQSDLRCFYNQTCINKLLSYYKTVPSMNITVTALDKKLLVQFLENSTIQEVVDQLMVEQWNKSIMYDQYYNACQPIKCAYTHQTKNSIVYIVTTLIGLLGGLVTVLKLIVPRVVIFVRKKQELIGPHIGKI
jgi:hypothetical protein